MAKKLTEKEVDINTKLLKELLSKAYPSKLLGRSGLFNKLKKQMLERILESAFDDKVISLYARGMTVSEIQSHLEVMYQTNISKDLISIVTNRVIKEVATWQERSLDNVYPIFYLDYIHVKARDNHTVINKTIHFSIGINIEGKKELLEIWGGKKESSKFGIQVVTELKNRGIKQIYTACVDGLKGFPEAINSIYPNTIVQLCIVHTVRNSVKYVSYKDLKRIYTTNSEEIGYLELKSFADKLDNKYPVISDMWQMNWSGIIPIFAFPDEIRRVIYTTNVIESINRQIRKIINNKGIFPDDKSILKIVFLVLKNSAQKWTMPIKNWSLALN